MIVLYAGALLAAQIPEIVDPYVSREGMVNWLGPVRHGGAAYTDDLDKASKVSYFKRQGIRWASPGHSLLVKILRPTGDLVFWAKTIPWLLMPLVLFFLFRIGERLGGPVAGFFACLLYLHMPLVRANMVAIPAGFALPTLISFLYFLQRRQTWAALICMGVGGLIYPTIVINCTALYVLYMARDEETGAFRLSLRDRRLWALGGVLVALFLIIAPPWEHTYDYLFRSGWSPSLVSYTEEIEREARLRIGGALPAAEMMFSHVVPQELILERWARDLGTATMQPLLFWGTPLLPFFEEAPFSMILGLQGLLALLCLAWAGSRQGTRLPRLVKDLIWTSLFLYMFAVLVFPLLFLPQRMAVFTLPVGVALLVAVLVTRATERLTGRWRQAAPLALAAAFLLFFGSGVPRPYTWVEDYRPAGKVLDHLKQTPKDSVVAGPLFLMDGVELISNRDTFLFCQEVIMTSHFLTGEFYDNVRRQHQELLTAYYATDPRVLLRFMERRGVDYVIAASDYFSEGFLGEYEPPCAFLPSDMERPKQVEPDAYFLAEPPPAVVTAGDQQYKVVSRKRLSQYLARAK